MIKAYIVTAVDYGDSADGKARTLGVFFDKAQAEKHLVEDMDTYKNHFESERRPMPKEDGRSLWYDDTNGCEWNIEEVEVDIPLTTLQILSLHDMAENIAHGKEDYFSEEGALSKEEQNYLIYILDSTYKILVLPKEGIALEGTLREKWLKEHGEEGK